MVSDDHQATVERQGDVQPALGHGVPWYEADGSVLGTGLTGTDRDIAERRQRRCAAAVERGRNAVKREAAAARRDQSQAEADQRAQVRLLAADARESGISDRDADASDRGQALADMDQRAENRDRAADDREHAASDRDADASDRDQTQADSDREHAVADRVAANRDQEHMRAELKLAQVDPLTGAVGRGLGLVALERDINRARRGNGLLVLAYIEVNELKQVNDNDGHASGDALLRDVANAIRRHLRPYDTLARIGGDEFLCALGNCSSQTAQTRFRKIRSVLAESQPTTISVGYAQLLPEETLEQLTERAELALYAARRSQ